MKLLPCAIASALLVLPMAAWADHNPDFDDDAKPILRMQPGLLEFVETVFQVKDTGVAKIPGNDDRQAMPPYIFRAKPRGYPGDYYITLLIQPGPPGHILKIVDPTKPHGGSLPHSSQGPGSYNSPQPPPQGYASAPSSSSNTAAQNPSPSTSSKSQTMPTADTPSGPIASNSGGVTPLPPPPSSNPPSLEPPPDPPPASH